MKISQDFRLLALRLSHLQQRPRRLLSCNLSVDDTRRARTQRAGCRKVYSKHFILSLLHFKAPVSNITKRSPFLNRHSRSRLRCFSEGGAQRCFGMHEKNGQRIGRRTLSAGRYYVYSGFTLSRREVITRSPEPAIAPRR
jgi:hypothetical protein